MVLTIITIISLLITGVFSFLRLSFAMEVSGLFIKNHPFSIALAIILLIYALIIVFICLKKYRFLEIDMSKTFKPLLIGKISAIAMLVACVFKIISLLTSFSAAKINIGDMIVILLTFITIFYYIAILILFNKGKIVNYISSISLISVLWSVALLIVNYVSLTQMSTTPEYCYIILAYVINILFFYYVAKVLSGYKCVLHCLIASSFAVIINGVAYLSSLIFNVLKIINSTTYISFKTFMYDLFGNLVFIMIIPFAFSIILFLIKESKEIKPEK